MSKKNLLIKYSPEKCPDFDLLNADRDKIAIVVQKPQKSDGPGNV